MHPALPTLPIGVQVHAAVLRGSNKEVVIKVLKPGVEDVLTTGEWGGHANDRGGLAHALWARDGSPSLLLPSLPCSLPLRP